SCLSPTTPTALSSASRVANSRRPGCGAIRACVAPSSHCRPCSSGHYLQESTGSVTDVVTSVDVRFDGSVSIGFTVPLSGNAACATAPGSDTTVFVDATTTVGKNQLATALAANLAGKKVVVMGNGTCGPGVFSQYEILNSTESLSYRRSRSRIAL